MRITILTWNSMRLWEERAALALSTPRLTLSLSIEIRARVRESATSVLTLTIYQAVITGAEIAVTVIPVAHTRERGQVNER
jgi:hypothetical protein